MEIVANIWPIVDESSGVVLRYRARAYVLSGRDDEISATLNTLARTDYAAARTFPIPESCRLVSEYGTISGAVMIGVMQQHMLQIIESGLSSMEAEIQERFRAAGGEAGATTPRFDDDPYLCITVLLEDADGRQRPVVRDGRR